MNYDNNEEKSEDKQGVKMDWRDVIGLIVAFIEVYSPGIVAVGLVMLLLSLLLR